MKGGPRDIRRSMREGAFFFLVYPKLSETAIGFTGLDRPPDVAGQPRIDPGECR